MALHSLFVQNVRIIEQIDISLAADANLFVGDNGAGKTSILEAIDILSRGRSFRERRTHPLLRTDAENLIIRSQLDSKEDPIQLGIQKSARQTKLRCNQENIASISHHASYLPVVSMHPDSHQLIQGGSKQRRTYLDWSAFHVKPTFLKQWRDYKQCLKQRNQALRDQCSPAELDVWTQELSTKAEQVDQARLSIFQELIDHFDEISRKLLPECEISVKYHRGWPTDISLQNALQEVLPQERQSKTTRLGAHRADLKIFLNQQEAAATASRGQQKLIAASLLLAQIQHLQQQAGQKCIVLLDDIRAELDQQHADTLMEALQTLGCQVFITAIDEKQVNLKGWQNTALFHVKQGVCEAVG